MRGRNAALQAGPLRWRASAEEGSAGTEPGTQPQVDAVFSLNSELTMLVLTELTESHS